MGVILMDDRLNDLNDRWGDVLSDFIATVIKQPDKEKYTEAAFQLSTCISASIYLVLKNFVEAEQWEDYIKTITKEALRHGKR